MSMQRCTIWSRKDLDADRLFSGFNNAADVVGCKVEISVGRVCYRNTPGTWVEILKLFPKHEFFGEAKWRFYNDNIDAQLQGKLMWPIYNPLNVPLTIEFDFYCGDVKSKTYRFPDMHLLIKFLHSLSESVSATSLLVEPKRIPSNILELQYERFKNKKDEICLPNVGWIFGLKLDSCENKRLQLNKIEFYETKEINGFIIYVLAESPLNYSSIRDMNLINIVEAKIGLV